MCTHVPKCAYQRRNQSLYYRHLQKWHCLSRCFLQSASSRSPCNATTNCRAAVLILLACCQLQTENQLWRQWAHERRIGQMMSCEIQYLVYANLSSIGLIIGSDALFAIGACCVACDGVAAALILCYANSLVVRALRKGQDHCKGTNMAQTLRGFCHYSRP